MAYVSRISRSFAPLECRLGLFAKWLIINGVYGVMIKDARIKLDALDCPNGPNNYRKFMRSI